MFLQQVDLKAIEKLGLGAYSEVWRAEQWCADGQQRKVIVRYLPVVANIVAFAREKEIYRRALHQGGAGIPRLLEVRRVGVGYLQIFQDAPGEELKKRLEQSPLSCEAALDLLIRLIKVLRSLNSWSVIHSDIKPDNLICDLNQRDIRLIDLTDCFKPGAFYEYEHYVGDRCYTPPERMQGWLNTSSQVFMLGLTLWEMLTSVSPFKVSTKTPFLNAAQLRWGVLNMERLSDCPLWLQRLIAHMLHPLADKRPTLEQINTILQYRTLLPPVQDDRGTVPMPGDEATAQLRLAQVGYHYPRFLMAVELEREGEQNKARHEYAALANAGYSRAQNNLGSLLQNSGRYETAVALFKAALKKGNPYAAFNLGRAYAAGQGVEKDLAAALHYFDWAARHGHMQAQYRLAGLLEEVGRDAEAVFWRQLAEAQERNADTE